MNDKFYFHCPKFQISPVCQIENAGAYDMFTPDMSIEDVEYEVKKVTSELMNVVLAIIQIALRYFPYDMLYSHIMAIEAIQCALTTGLARDLWKILAAFMIIAHDNNVSHYFNDSFNQFYPYLCTCKSDVERLIQILGPEARTVSVSCGK